MTANFQLISRRLEANPNAMALFQACETLSNRDYRLLLESSEAGHNGKQQSILFAVQSASTSAQRVLKKLQSPSAPRSWH